VGSADIVGAGVSAAVGAAECVGTGEGFTGVFGLQPVTSAKSSDDIIRIGNNFFMNLPPCLIIGIIKADVQGLLSPCTVGLF